MNLQDELKQLEAYYQICNYTGKLVCAALIDGAQDILAGKECTVDAHASNREELERRILDFYLNLEDWLVVDY